MKDKLDSLYRSLSCPKDASSSHALKSKFLLHLKIQFSITYLGILMPADIKSLENINNIIELY